MCRPRVSWLARIACIEMSLFEIKIEIPAAAADLTNETLLEFENGAWSLLEDVIAGRAWVIGIFSTEAEARFRLAELRPRLAEPALNEPELRELRDSEWRDSYKAHFHAWQFGRLHWVPVWEREAFRLPAGDAVLWLDPGLAFGTGNHETTRLCVERLVELAGRQGTLESEVARSEFENSAANVGGADDSNRQRDHKRRISGLRVIDAGCGSGILALSAAKLGYGRVEGFDNDAEAVRVSRENAALNALEHEVRFFVGELKNGLAHACADVVLANILADVLVRHARELTAAVAPGGVLVLSGILALERDEVREKFARIAPDWNQDSRTMGEWSDVMLIRPD